MSITSDFTASISRRFKAYKILGDEAFKQLHDNDFFYQPSAESNSIAIIIQHFYGNALSRFTDFLTSDGEKDWRNRDAEFEPMNCSTQDLLSFWEAGWKQLFTTLDNLTEDDLDNTVYIRGEPLIAFDALLRQLAHYAYHVGQIVYIAKSLRNGDWKTLSIAKNKSAAYNRQMNTN